MKKTICLNMIVKDEAHIIEESLEKLCKKVAFDYWVICDTGSTDNTPTIIQNFFSKKGIKGELVNDTWKDFGHNRTRALERAFGKTDYLLVFDADDEIEGDFTLPDLIVDGYQLKFGRKTEYTYDRTLLLNNRKRWRFIGVLHEIIQCLEPTCKIEMIHGDYCVVSGRVGNRNKDPNKYYKDGIILEKAFLDAIVNNENTTIRYCFYCANSFFDAGHYERAIEWYKRYLKIGNWNQEKYVSCRNMYTCYEKLNQRETGIYYLIESLAYDRERMECMHELVQYYCQQKQYDVAWAFYNIIKPFYETEFLNCDFSLKLFYDKSKSDLFLPANMAILSSITKQTETGLKMYEIIFKKQYRLFPTDAVHKILHHFQFIIGSIPPARKSEYYTMFNNYIAFLESIKIQMEPYTEYITKYRELLTTANTATNAIVNTATNAIANTATNAIVNTATNATAKPNLLLLTGFLNSKWNYNTAISGSLGGSETAAAYLAKEFAADYNVYVGGDVEEGVYDGVQYVDNTNIRNLIANTSFQTVIISRFLIFLEIILQIKAQKVYIWAHDTELVPIGTNLTAKQLLQKWNSRIDGVICLTDWHKNLFIQQYPEIKDKIRIINNGILTSLFANVNTKRKIKNRFVYTSRSERGLARLLQLWPNITAKLPNATLSIASYNDFPKDADDVILKEAIDRYPNIKHFGKLCKRDLYEMMAMAEYWFYPCTYAETSCITALEMMFCEVIPIYYPIAGLVNTIGNYGVQVTKSNEVDVIHFLTKDESADFRNSLRTNCRKYAQACDWSNKKITWRETMANRICILILYSDSEYYRQMKQMLDSYYNKYTGGAIDYYFISYDPTLQSDHVLNGHNLTIKGTESYLPGILDKTLYALNMFKGKYDYYVRSNVSTIIDFNQLDVYLRNNRIEYGGFNMKLEWLDEEFGIVDQTYFGTVFVQGTSITMSRGAVDLLLEKKQELPPIIDDIAIGHLFNKHSITPINNEHITFNSEKKVDGCVFYRNKTSYDKKMKDDKKLQEQILRNMAAVIGELA